MTTLYKFRTTVSKVEFKKEIVRAHKEGDQVVTEEADLGWFVLLTGSKEWLRIGDPVVSGIRPDGTPRMGWEKPDLGVGDHVEVIIRKAVT